MRRREIRGERTNVKKDSPTKLSLFWASFLRWGELYLGMLILRIFAALSAVAFISCVPGAGGASSGSMGDLPADDGAVGGISEVPNPSPEMAKVSGTSLETLQHGHVTYMLKCGECHAYQIPEHLFVDEWEDAMPKMIRHAGLQSADEKAVLAYVLAVKKMKGR